MSPSLRPSRGTVVLLAAIVATVAFSVLQSFMAPLLPSLQETFDISTTTVTWLMTGYLLSACITAPIVGRLGDIYGHVLVLRIAMLVMTGGMVLQALSWSFETLLAARFIQGCGGAIIPLCYVILKRMLPEERVPFALGIVSSMAALGGGTGLVMVGLVVHIGDFHLAFWTASVIGALSSLVVFLGIPASTDERTRQRLDALGALLLAIWLSLLLIIVSQGGAFGWLSLPIVLMIVGALVAFVLWVWWEQKVDVPVIDIRVMRSRPVVWSNLLAFFFGIMMFTTQILFPQFLQTSPAQGYGFGLTVGGISLAMLPQTAAFGVGGLFAGWLERTIGSRMSIIIGSLFCTVGFSGLLIFHNNVVQFSSTIVLIGIGIGLTYAQLANVVTRSVPADTVGASTGMNTNIRNIGGAVGTTLAATIIMAPAGLQVPPIFNFAIGIFLLIGVSIAAMLCAAALPKDRDLEFAQ